MKTQSYLFRGAVSALVLATFAAPTAIADDFIRGDANGDGNVDIADTETMFRQLYTLGFPASTCDDANDVNDDGQVDVSDVVYLLNALFVPGSPPMTVPNPWTGPGPDTTPDPLDCSSYDGGPPLSYPTWETELELASPFENNATAFAPLSDGSVLFAGNYSSDWTVDEGIWLWKFDSDGQLIWEQSLIRPGGDRIRVKTVVAENGGRIFLMGYSLTDEELVVMEIDEEGNLLDVQEYAYPSTMSFVFIGGDSESMIPLYDEYGQFEGLGIAATILASAPGGSSIMNMFHTRLSSDLSVEPGYPLLFGAPGQTSTTSEGLLQLPDGTVVLYGWGSGGLSALVRVDVDGSLIWDDYTTTGSDSTIIRDLERLPNGDLISFGAIRTPALAPVAPWREYVRVHDLSTGVVVNEMEYQSAAEGVASTRLPGGDYAFISKLTPASSGYNITTISSSTLSVIDQDFAPLAGSTVLPLGFDYYPTQVTVMQDGDLGILSYSTPVGFYLDPLAGQFVKLKSDITFP